MAAEQGFATAQFRLGQMYADGKGVPKDVVEAARWLRLAAEQGNADAQFKLGLMYALGKGVPKDYVQAYVWMNIGAAQIGDEESGKAFESHRRRNDSFCHYKSPESVTRILGNPMGLIGFRQNSEV